MDFKTLKIKLNKIGIGVLYSEKEWNKIKDFAEEMNITYYDIYKNIDSIKDTCLPDLDLLLSILRLAYSGGLH